VVEEIWRGGARGRSLAANIACGLANLSAKWAALSLGRQGKHTTGRTGMSRVAKSLSILAIAAAVTGGAFAQTSTSEKPKMDQATQKMKVSQDPSSPAMQQAAAKQANCKKEAKTKKLKGSARKAFMTDCTK
jgi:psiF repeat